MKRLALLVLFGSGCAATFAEREPTMACYEACACVEHLTTKVAVSSTPEGDNCACLLMDGAGVRSVAVVPRRPPLGSCE